MQLSEDEVYDAHVDRLLSIITVCRNDVLRLKKTIISLGAFYGDERFEHLVVDGSSTDNTRHLVEPFIAETNFKYHVVTDCGIFDAMNLGISYSRSPLLLFLNCGDTVIGSPDEFYAAFCKLTRQNNSEPDIACFPIRQVVGDVFKTLVPKTSSRHKMPTSHQGMIFGKQFILRNRYETIYKIAGDYDLYLRAERITVLGAEICQSLVAVEAEGYASAHPVRAYCEYIIIASRRLKGAPKLMAIFLIMARALLVIPIKLFLPSKWILILKGI
ncbi:MAG: glycosyltransferase [Proteobacteria bacterium]|nr:glycosyltransferase [Pseudomonadota bacterium]